MVVEGAKECYFCSTTKGLIEHHVFYDPEVSVWMCNRCHTRFHGLLRRVKKIAKVCEECGKSFEVYPSEKKRRFCSWKCFVTHERRIHLKKKAKGESFGGGHRLAPSEGQKET